MLCVGAHQSGELLVDDLDDHLGRSQGLQDLGVNTPGSDGLDKVLDDLVADVRFQQCHPNFTHGLLDVGLLDAALAAQLFEGRVDLFR